MYDVYIICTYRHLFPLLDSLREYTHRTASRVGASVEDFGMSQKLVQACIILSFPHAVDEACIAQLEADSRVIDYYLFADDEQAETLPLALVPAPGRMRLCHP